MNKLLFAGVLALQLTLACKKAEETKADPAASPAKSAPEETAEKSAPSASAKAKAKAAKAAPAGDDEALELTAIDQTMADEGIQGCVGKDVVIKLPMYHDTDEWKVVKIDKAFPKPKKTDRPGMLGPNTDGVEFRWSTAAMHGGTYWIHFNNGTETLKVKVVLSCDD